MEENQKQKYISLTEAAKLCSYSEPYLRLRARGGKLKSIKLGKKWMTTSAWLDDYQARAQEWRESAEAKRAQAPVAVFVAAPAELHGNIDCPAADIEPALGGSPMRDAVPLEQGDLLPNGGQHRQRDGAPAAVFCDQNSAMLLPPVPKRLREIPITGQIYPLPKSEQTRIGEVSDYGWLGALVSGAALALLLFLALNQSGIPGIIKSNHGLGQANMSRIAINGGSGQTFEAPRPSPGGPAETAEIFFAGDPLKELVQALAGFFREY